ncbi:hypothetical protein NEFER03_1088 [Nematocida sp. LUAm3]|nr:hypothetical protein NEFER03_1088 [Nematocida sp. LUAm3]KAI5175307.1 hypothetical protein NEFER02_1236 [Nematocida sp. LUAm2]KAI5177736.1 hypothetical protein NEFER01_0960 [Nematocida sp. LUAm1]
MKEHQLSNEEIEEKKGINKTHPYKLLFTNRLKKRKVEDRMVLSEERDSNTPVFINPLVKKEHKEKKEKLSTFERLLKANYVLSSYLSLLLNGFLVILSIVLIIKFVLMVKNDISVKTIRKLEENKQKIEECAKQYKLNRCSPEERVPALEEKCKEWETCMRNDPLREELTRVVFQVASNTIEEFLNGISIRSAFILTAIATVLLKVILSCTK